MNPLQNTADLFQSVASSLNNFTQTAGKQTNQDKGDIDFQFDQLLDFIEIEDDEDSALDPSFTSYTISYSPNGGSGIMADKTGYHGRSTFLSRNKYKREGYDFQGWTDIEDSSIVKYYDRQIINISNKIITKIILYAVWKIKQYTISLNANGGTGTGVSKKINYGTVYDIPENPFKKTGYIFVGWSTSASDTVAKYSDKGKITVIQNTTLYAIWRVDKFYIAFNSNGGSGSMSRQEVESGKSVKLTSNAFTKSGYTFSGWATSASGKKAYSDGQTITPTSDLTLYAVWTKVSAQTISTTTQFWYGRVNRWGKSTSMLASEISTMKSYGLTGYMIEAAIYNEDKIKNLKKADMSNASKKKIYDDWFKDIEGKYKYLLDLCRKNNMWLFISLVNDNAISKTGFQAAFLYDIVATDLMNMVIKYGSTGVVVQPTAEVGSEKGKSFNKSSTSKLKSNGFLVANGGAKHGDDSNSAGANYMAYHQSEYNQSLGTPSKTFIVSDNTSMINWLNKSTSNIKTWRNWVKNKKYLVCGYYDVREDGVNTAAIKAMANK